MAHANRVILQKSDAESLSRKTVPDLNAALEFIKNSTLNSTESFTVSMEKNSKIELAVTINSIPKIRKEESKTRVHIPAGLYDMFW